MSNLKVRLQLSLDRCNEAYRMYQTEKKYYQAKRVYKANKVLYNLLEEYLFAYPDNKKETINFIFHLEDWFEQFSALEIELKNNLNLSSEFIFLRLDKSPPFPVNFSVNK